ncbi:MAG: 4-(cytidine 5'-diphospho)-2-C-methyl-D-erythritol kinase [Bacteroidales bacterium]|nr:4-(cytidine 5'-diphospho)-2-C-methyl-D-erythritol kinase [Bacteroidales bacterium]
MPVREPEIQQEPVLRQKAAAKINLALHITGRRADGYHLLDTLVTFGEYGDVIEARVADDLTLEVVGQFAGSLQSETDNLVLKAAQLLKQSTADKGLTIPGAAITLEKQLPIASGIGGGSADAAFFIRAANVFFSLGMDESKMREMAVQLGSDCPFFIENKPVLARGKGDVLQAVNISLKGKYLLVCQPKALVSSREAYTLIKPGISKTGIKEVVAKPIEQWRDLLKNDFEDVLFDLHPEIREIKNSMHKMGAIYSSMTGSGSAVYGIFDQSPDRKEINPNYYLWHGEI